MNIERLLRNAIKIAAVVLTAPATIAVSSTLYADSGLYRWVVSAACLVLVEGSLLLGWYLLDTNSQATIAQRNLYAALIIVAYGVLWLVALAHGEGIAGIAFRATLGVVISYSIIDSGILANMRDERATMRDPSRDRKVRKHQRALSVSDAIADLDVAYQIKALARDNMRDEECKRLATQHKDNMSAIRESFVDASPRSKRNLTIAGDSGLSVKMTKKLKVIEQIETAMLANPDLSQSGLASIVGLSRQTVNRYLRDKSRAEIDND